MFPVYQNKWYIQRLCQSHGTAEIYQEGNEKKPKLVIYRYKNEMKDESYIEYDKYGKCHGAIFSLISVSIGLM